MSSRQVFETPDGYEALSWGQKSTFESRLMEGDDLGNLADDDYVDFLRAIYPDTRQAYDNGYDGRAAHRDWNNTYEQDRITVAMLGSNANYDGMWPPPIGAPHKQNGSMMYDDPNKIFEAFWGVPIEWQQQGKDKNNPSQAKWLSRERFVQAYGAEPEAILPPEEYPPGVGDWRPVCIPPSIALNPSKNFTCGDKFACVCAMQNGV